MNVKVTPVTDASELSPACIKSLKEEALKDWMREVTELLCYQPDVPLKHKEDLVRAMDEYLQFFSGDEQTHKLSTA